MIIHIVQKLLYTILIISLSPKKNFETKCEQRTLHWQVCVYNQGTWELDGEMLKGKFTRKDNNKVLTTTRTMVGGELVQVCGSTSPTAGQTLQLNFSVTPSFLFSLLHSQSFNYEGVDAKRIFKKQ